METENLDLDLAKALDTLGTGGTGSQHLIPERVNPGIRRYVETSSPLLAIIRALPWDSKFYETRAVTALPSAGPSAEGAVVANSDETYIKPLQEMKYVTSRGKVTGPELAATRSVVNLWAEKIELHTLAMVRELERQIIEGDKDGTPLEFDGILQQVALVEDPSPDAGVTKPLLTLAMIDAAMDRSMAYPTHAVYSRAMGRRLWSVLQAQQRFIDRTEVGAGFRIPTYNDVPLIRVDNEHSTLLPNDVLFIDNTKIVRPVLLDTTFEPIGKVDDHDEFFIKTYTCLSVEGTNVAHVRLTNVSATAA